MQQLLPSGCLRSIIRTLAARDLAELLECRRLMVIFCPSLIAR
jgi:hypothetical protein